MIQASTESSFNAYLSTMDNTSSDGDRLLIRYLVKFINDLDGSVDYCYPLVTKDGGANSTIYDRYTKMTFYTASFPDMFAGQLYIPLAGHYKYEVYEVEWVEGDTVTLDEEHAPNTELDYISGVKNMDDAGYLRGLVTKGILNVTEKAGDEQVQYTQNAKSVQTITLEWGGESYTTVPTVVFTGDCITAATATCTIAAGVVNAITLTSGGSGYTSNPVVTIQGGTTSTNVARATASIKETNYIYTG